MSINKVILIGNVGQSPDIKVISDTMKVAKITLATSEKKKEETETTWHNLVAFNKTADLFEKYVNKGDKLYVEGKISNRSYSDKDGNKKYVSEIIVEKIDFLTSKNNSTSDQQPSIQAEVVKNSGDGDDLPF